MSLKSAKFNSKILPLLKIASVFLSIVGLVAASTASLIILHQPREPKSLKRR